MSGSPMSIVGLVLIAAVLIVPLVVGCLLIVRSRGRGPGFPSCGGCGYNVSATLGTVARCPECGKDFAEVGVMPPGGKRNGVMLWAGIVVLLVPFTCGGFGLLAAGMAHLRATSAQQAAMVRQQAVAAQLQAQLQANATKPIPASLTKDQIASMTAEEASAAHGAVSAALTRTDLTDAVRTRLEQEFNDLAERTKQP